MKLTLLLAASLFFASPVLSADFSKQAPSVNIDVVPNYMDQTKPYKEFFNTVINLKGTLYKVQDAGVKRIFEQLAASLPVGKFKGIYLVKFDDGSFTAVMFNTAGDIFPATMIFGDAARFAKFTEAFPDMKSLDLILLGGTNI